MPATTRRARSSALEALRVNTILGRARARLSQEDLADQAGVSRPTISRIERGTSADVGLETIERIAGALGIAVADIFVFPSEGRVGGKDELARRAAAADEGLAFLDAVGEAAGQEVERYSRAGRPPLAR